MSKKRKRFHPWKQVNSTKAKHAEVIHAEDIPTWLSAWINPEGTIFHVEPLGHARAAHELGSTVDELEWEGWVHLTFGSVVMLQRPTRAQMAALHKIMRYVGKNTAPASFFAIRRSAEVFGF